MDKAQISDLLSLKPGRRTRGISVKVWFKSSSENTPGRKGAKQPASCPERRSSCLWTRVSQLASAAESDVISSYEPSSGHSDTADKSLIRFTESNILLYWALNFAAQQCLSGENQDKLYLVVVKLFCFSGYWIMIR